MANARKSQDNYNKHFPKLLRELMGEHNVKHETLANYVGVSRQCIGQYSNGETNPDLYTFSKIVEYFKKEKGIEYSMEYWIGNESVNSGMSIGELNYPDKTIQMLKKYNNDIFVKFMICFILEKKEFIEELKKYLIDSNLSKIFSENTELNDLYYYNFPNFRYTSEYFGNYKYCYASLLEMLPKLNIELKEILSKDKNIIFETIRRIKEYSAELDKMMETPDRDMINMDEEEESYSIELNEEFELEEKKWQELLEKPKYEKLINDYNKYITDNNLNSELLIKRSEDNGNT